MKVQYVFQDQVATIEKVAQEMKEALEALKDQVEGIKYPSLADVTKEYGQWVIGIEVTMTPKQIMKALELGGYEGDTIVGVNNETGGILFSDEINDMFIVGQVSLTFKGGLILGEHEQAGAKDCFSTFKGF